jgi:GTPase
MTREHLGIALILKIPFFVVVTKIDISPPDVLLKTLETLGKILKSPSFAKLPILVKDT